MALLPAGLFWFLKVGGWGPAGDKTCHTLRLNSIWLPSSPLSISVRLLLQVKEKNLSHRLSSRAPLSPRDLSIDAVTSPQVHVASSWEPPRAPGAWDSGPSPVRALFSQNVCIFNSQPSLSHDAFLACCLSKPSILEIELLEQPDSLPVSFAPTATLPAHRGAGLAPRPSPI